MWAHDQKALRKVGHLCLGALVYQTWLRGDPFFGIRGKGYGAGKQNPRKAVDGHRTPNKSQEALKRSFSLGGKILVSGFMVLVDLSRLDCARSLRKRTCDTPEIL